MKTQNIELMTAEIDAHRAADRLVQGKYFDKDTGRGCFIGCLTHGNSPELIEEWFGVPEPLTHLLESIFDRLPFDEASEFFSEIPRAIGEDGRDLTRVHWAFLADLLRHLPDTQARDVVADVIAGMDLLAAGKDWPGAAQARAMAWSAVEAVEARATLAQAARAWAVEAAYWAQVRAAEEVTRAGAVEARAAEAAAYWAAEAAAYWAAQADGGSREIRRQRDVILRLIQEA